MTARLARLLFALFMLLSFALPAHAGRITPVEGLELVRKSFAGMTDFTAEITQEKQIALMKKKLVSSGVVRFKRPDSFFMEIYSPYASRLLLRDNVMTMHLPAEGVRQKHVLPPEEGLLRWFSLLDRPVTKLPEGVNILAEQRGDTVTLRIIPAGKKGVKELQLALNGDGRLKRLVIEEQNRDRTVITFHGVKKNVGLSEKDFRVE